MEPARAARNALECVLEAEKNEKLVIFCDDVRADVGEAFHKGAKDLGLRTTYVLLETSDKVFRKEIPSQHLKLLTTDRPDIYINLLRGIREETPFRIKLIHAETDDHTKRLAHCPGITMDMLTEGALALTAAEHRRMQAFADKLMKKMEKAVKIELTNPAGTNLTFSVKDRPFFTDTKLDWETMKWMNLPTGEVIVAPVEDSLEGTLVCDMAIGGIGPLKTPFTIVAKNGKVQETRSKDASVKKRVDESLATDDMAKVVGEFAFGINPKARLVEEFLETEKIKGTVHIAFGDNSDFPSGKNNSANHMDFLMNKPTVKADTRNGAKSNVMKNGVFQI
jgi:leucyl aminopeptidase (aminopeptidase T)